jgi:tetratricopeptide (TPR) repeat protein
MQRPPEELKQICDRVACLLSSPGQANGFRWLEALSAGVPQEPWPVWDWKPPDQIGRVAIWSRTGPESKASFRRIPGKDPEKLWSRVECIEPKRDKRRIVLIGESAAQGFLCAPHYSPALALEQMLRSEYDDVEIIDLTRLGLDLWELLDLMHSCRALDPDAVVIFAGNNWNPLWSVKYGWNGSTLRRLGATLQTAGIEGVKAELLKKLDRMLGAFRQQVKLLSEDHAVPVVFVLPEFNLADWREAVPVSPLLPSARLHRWLDQRCEAENALQTGMLDRAILAANDMLDQDRGTHPAAYYLLADALRQEGRTEDAREALERARDANFGISYYEPSRCYGPIQQAVRTLALDSGFFLVDCGRCFDAFLGNAIPDRRVFLDMCHLSADGIRLVMAHVAAQLSRILGTDRPSAERFYDTGPPLSPQALSEICISAALYNAVRDQPRELIQYWLCRALQSHKPSAALMRSLLDQMIRRDPLPFSVPLLSAIDSHYDGGARNSGDTSVGPIFDHLLHCINIREPRRLDLSLIGAISDVLSSQDPSLPAQVCTRLVTEHAVGTQPLSLLESLYSEVPQVTGRSWAARCLTAYESYQVESSFVLVWDGSSGMEAVMTYRVPGSSWAGPSAVAVAVNGALQASFEPDNRWQTVRFSLDASTLRVGPNRLTVSWPWPVDAVDEYRETLLETLATGKMIENRIMIPHGEIYQLDVRSIPT